MIELSFLLDYWCGASIILFIYNNHTPLFEKFGIQQILLILLFSWIIVPIMTVLAILNILEHGFLSSYNEQM